jgi:capsular exopolysaccharide synthesis family protein
MPELITYEQPKSLLSEAIFNLHTAVLLSSAGGPPGILIVTSANPSEGKSTVSVNLASALASNKRVVIIDADMRKPRIHTIFGQPGQPGLSNLLSGGISLAEILYPTQIPNLFFIPAGTIPPNPVQLVTSEAFTELLQELEKDFKHVIIDTPPLIGFAEARAISSLAEGVLLVVKHHATSRGAVRLAVQLLGQVSAPLLGAVLNMVQSDKLGYGGYYGYYKHYSHYYKQYNEAKQIDLNE